MPSTNAAAPLAHAKSMGMVRARLLKKVSPPRWSNTLIIKKKYATSTISTTNITTDNEPGFVFGKKLIFIVTAS
jgi:hypothetical protein